MAKKKHIEVSQDTHEQVKVKAVLSGKTMAVLIAELIAEYEPKR